MTKQLAFTVVVSMIMVGELGSISRAFMLEDLRWR
jgi:hypothetical protein